jgi:hypothetical protein
LEKLKKMQKLSKRINNENGSVMAIALLIMATLAIAGALVANDAVMESRVARNYGIHKQCLSAAEAAGKEFIQAIDSIFIDPANPTGSDAIAKLDSEPWSPHDGDNTTFDFDEANWTAYNLKNSNIAGTIGYLTSAEAIAVLVERSSSVSKHGLGGKKVVEFYTYVIYSRAVHAGAGNSEVILMIGYKQKKV